MGNNVVVKAAVLTAVVLAAVGVGVVSLRARYTGIRAGKPDANYIRSTDCRVCHEDHFASWSRTHHSRMTQEARTESVQGDFTKNNTFEYQGVTARMSRNSGTFAMEFTFPDGKRESYRVERTIGSRRIEQYVAKTGTQYFRLPVAWDVEQRRWMSLNGSFFYPDGTDFKKHFTQWDTNCVFCHNVKAQPNFNFATRQANTEVSELGISCGACHAQGAEHADEAASPITRALWRWNEKANTKVVDPLRLDSDRALMVCGHCHGQRIPEPQDRIREILGTGDPFNAGDDLSRYYRPVHAETQIGSLSFATRFWADGSPRLTAYEYQGILDSQCFKKGTPGSRITCISCHTMHEGDVNGQLTDAKRSNAGCTQCHSQLSDPTAVKNHTKHDANSPGSSCYACHMPPVVYGVQSIHPTHQITIPDPGKTAAQNVPNACNQCHVDRSLNWTIQQARAMWPTRYSDLKESADERHNMPETVRELFAGDALTRVLMADALSRHGNPDLARPLLLEAFSGDNYPVVRYFAANGLAAFDNSLAKPDYLGTSESRSAQVDAWISRVDPLTWRTTHETAARLRASRQDVDLEVGE